MIGILPLKQRKRHAEMRLRHSVGTFSAPERFLLYMSRASLNAPHFHRDNRREAVGLIERDSAMGRVSQPSRTSATLIATAATLAAMTAYNVYRARKVEREHPPTASL